MNPHIAQFIRVTDIIHLLLINQVSRKATTFSKSKKKPFVECVNDGSIENISVIRYKKCNVTARKIYIH